MFNSQFKTLAILLMLCVTVSAAVSISTDKAEYDCGNLGEICEIVNINIFKTDAPLGEQVHLRIDYTDESGEITQINNFFKHNWKTRYELTDPFDLPNGNKYYDMEFKAWGSGKFNISIIGSESGIIYDVLDPWWSSDRKKRIPFNFSLSGSAVYDYHADDWVDETNKWDLETTGGSTIDEYSNSYIEIRQSQTDAAVFTANATTSTALLTETNDYTESYFKRWVGGRGDGTCATTTKSIIMVTNGTTEVEMFDWVLSDYSAPCTTETDSTEKVFKLLRTNSTGVDLYVDDVLNYSYNGIEGDLKIKYKSQAVGSGTQIATADLEFYNHTYYDASASATDIQRMLTLNSSNVNYSEFLTDGQDILFTWVNESNSSVEQVIPHCIPDEQWDTGGNSYLWFKAPLVDLDGETFYMYFDNNTAVTDQADCKGTFELYDNCNDGSINATLWTTSGTVTESGGVCSVINTAGNDYMYSNNVFGEEYSLITRAGFGAGVGSAFCHGIGSDIYCNGGTSTAFRYSGGSGLSIRDTHTSVNPNPGFQVTTTANNTYSIFRGNAIESVVQKNYGTSGEYISGYYSFTDTTIRFSAHSTSSGTGAIYIDWTAIFKTTPFDEVLQQAPEQSFAIINTPYEGQQVQKDYVILNFSSVTANNYSLFVDDVFDKNITLNDTVDSYEEVFAGFSIGTHNFTVALAEDVSVNTTVSFEAVDYALESWTYTSNPNEVDSETITAIMIHAADEITDNATLNYNGTEYTMTVSYLNSTHDSLSTNVITPFIVTGSTLSQWFYLDANSNASSNFVTENETQTVQQAYYISSLTLPSSGVEGEEITANLTITNNADFAIVNVYINSTNIGNLLATQLTNGTTQDWERVFNLPSVDTPTVETIQSYITVTYGGDTAYRYFATDSNITVSPVSVGLCGGAFDIVILNYSAWDEKNNSLQITANNFWETEVIARAPGGSVNTTFGFTGTGSTHAICLENNDSIVLDVSTWISNNASNYVRRSWFIQNTEYSNESATEYIRIHLLNVSDASVVNFIVKDAFDRPQENRIVKFFKFDAVNQSYREMFNLLTDINGRAVGFVEAYDQWYKIVVTDSDNVITATIPSTQFDTSTYPIIETSTEFGQLEGMTWLAQWNNASKVFSLTVGSDESRTFQLEVLEMGIFANTSYCTTEFTGTTGVLYCDLSASSVDEFRWILSYEGEDVQGNTLWVPITSGFVEQPESPPYGLAGLVLTGFLLIMGATLYTRDARNLILVIPIILTIARAFELWTVSYVAVMAMWAVAIVLVFILRGEKR